MNKVKLAVFECPEPNRNGSFVQLIKTETEGPYTQWIRVSEWIEVEFERLDDEVTIPQKVERIREAIQNMHITHARDIEEKEEAIKSLLTLSYSSAAEVDNCVDDIAAM